MSLQGKVTDKHSMVEDVINSRIEAPVKPPGADAMIDHARASPSVPLYAAAQPINSKGAGKKMPMPQMVMAVRDAKKQQPKEAPPMERMNLPKNRNAWPLCL